MAAPIPAKLPSHQLRLTNVSTIFDHKSTSSPCQKFYHRNDSLQVTIVVLYYIETARPIAMKMNPHFWQSTQHD